MPTANRQQFPKTEASPLPERPGAPEPPENCERCPRLVDFRAANRQRFPGFLNAPVPAVGSEAPALLLIGLAPGLKGANRTGIPFQGDGSGTFLHAALRRCGLDIDGDGPDVPPIRLTNAVRCVPPGNRPIAAEVAACREFLINEIAAASPRVAVALGHLAHEAVLAACGLRRRDFPFAHGARHMLPGFILFDSYHPSRQNTQTGRLTGPMMDDVLTAARDAAMSG